MPVFRDFCSTNRTGENGLLGNDARQKPGFLCGRNQQSDFLDFVLAKIKRSQTE
jgi:hypothetical protein